MEDYKRNYEFEKVDINTLVDIRDVSIQIDNPKEERINNYIKQIKNPYLFRYKNMVVKLDFTDTDITLEKLIEDYATEL